MGRAGAVVLGLAALSLVAVAVVIFTGSLSLLAIRLWRLVFREASEAAPSRFEPPETPPGKPRRRFTWLRRS